MKSWRVIIPSNDARKCRIAVKSALSSHPDLLPSEIIVVDDGARSGWEAADPAVTWVEGRKPFIFARNVNLGIDAAGQVDGFVIMNDDCFVVTPKAFDFLQATSNRKEVGITSAAIQGRIGNPRQRFRNNRIVIESQGAVAFVCVYVTRSVWKNIGRLDERFIHYGCEDTDYCKRVKDAGLKLMIDQRVCVKHNGSGQPSAWRSRKDFARCHNYNKRLYAEKWKEPQI